MTQKTKLEIIGPYTPEHEGPHLFNGEECLVHGTLGTQAFISRPENDRGFIANTFDIRNAREVPVAREFWDVVGKYNGKFYARFNSMAAAGGYWCISGDDTEVIHVREVLPGGGA
ncbi:MAG: hypothetical protein ABF759_12135 [Acetobacter malorum]|uniref:hypothetical protein n=1 Tax=Acetobacter malorum TaxID=178901 RepID=UPI0039EA0B88